MRACQVFKVLTVLMAVALVLVGCAQPPAEPPAATATATAAATARPTDRPVATIAPTIPATVAEVAPTDEPVARPVVVVLVKDGNVDLWEEATGQRETIFSAGDATAVWLSDDGRMIAFLRRTLVDLSEGSPREEYALWAVDRTGENARELLAAEDLRQLLSAGDGDSTNVFQIAWIPQTHRLVLSGARYMVQAEGFSHARPEGLFQVDADRPETAVLAAVDQSLRFVPSPTGARLALMSTTGLSFAAADGSDRGPERLTYPEVGVPQRIFPNGVWTEDEQAFVIAAPIESESEMILNFTIWRVPVDGSPAQELATVRKDSHPASVTFSPDGRLAAYYQWPEQAWPIISLAPEAGPLAIPPGIELGYANPHWSPAGVGYSLPLAVVSQLYELCPDATLDTNVCHSPVDLGTRPAYIRWIDGSRFLYLTREPAALVLGGLDGARVPIVTWRPEEAAGPQSFDTLPATD